MYNVTCTFDPKPVPGDWNGAGGHTNYSNKATRTEETGYEAIKEQIKKLEQKHAVHIAGSILPSLSSPGDVTLRL